MGWGGLGGEVTEQVGLEKRERGGQWSLEQKPVGLRGSLPALHLSSAVLVSRAGPPQLTMTAHWSPGPCYASQERELTGISQGASTLFSAGQLSVQAWLAVVSGLSASLLSLTFPGFPVLQSLLLHFVT